MTTLEDSLAPPFVRPAGRGWAPELGLRMRRMLALKLVGVTAFTWLFFVAYFHLLQHPILPVTVMPLTALDRLIPFQPEALFAYLTLWLYVGVAPGLQWRFIELVVYGLWIAALCLTGLACFYYWPTQVPPMTIDVAGLPGFSMLKGVDAGGNACPSMHVAVAIFTAIRIDDVLRRAGAPRSLQAINVVWFVAIAFSTVAIRQHVVLDVIAGALLGIAFALPSMRWRPAPDPVVAADIIAHR